MPSAEELEAQRLQRTINRPVPTAPADDFGPVHRAVAAQGEPNPYEYHHVETLAALTEALTTWLPRIATELRGIKEAIQQAADE